MRNLFIAILFSVFSTASFAKIVTVYIPFSPGGPSDSLWRTIEPKLNDLLKDENIKLITENLPGAGGAIAANRIAATDNRLVLGFFSPALVITPVINPQITKYTYDSIRFLGYAGGAEMLLVSSLEEQEFYKKCSSGGMMYGSSGVGSSTHLLAAFVIKSLKCKDSVHVPYRGQAAAYLDLLPGRIDYIVDFSISANSYLLSQSVNKIFSVTERFPSVLENWHILISNQFGGEEFEIIKSAYEELKRDEYFVSDLEEKFHIENFSQERNSEWLLNEFNLFKNFVNDLGE